MSIRKHYSHSSLLVVEQGTGDPLARGRITIAGKTRVLEKGSDLDTVREGFLRSHPNAAYYIDYRDFHLWLLEDVVNRGRRLARRHTRSHRGPMPRTSSGT